MLAENGPGTGFLGSHFFSNSGLDLTIWHDHFQSVTNSWIPIVTVSIHYIVRYNKGRLIYRGENWSQKWLWTDCGSHLQISTVSASLERHRASVDHGMSCLLRKLWVTNSFQILIWGVKKYGRVEGGKRNCRNCCIIYWFGVHHFWR